MTDESGFTLIEIMVAMVLIMIAMIGLNSAFSVMSAVSRDLTIRQKAVFTLDNEMERLYGLYSRSKRFSTFLSDWNGDFCGSPGREEPYDSTMVADTEAYNITTSAISSIDDIAGVYIDSNGDNIVPIDFEKKITGKLTWSCTKDDDIDTKYYDVILTIDYPYRFVSGSYPVNDSDPVLVKQETLDLITSFRY